LPVKEWQKRKKEVEMTEDEIGVHTRNAINSIYYPYKEEPKKTKVSNKAGEMNA